MNQQIVKSQEEILRDSFEQWIAHPVTKLVIQAILKHKKSFIDRMTSGACDSEITDQQIRFHTVNMKNTEAVLKIITDFPTLTAQINKT